MPYHHRFTSHAADWVECPTCEGNRVRTELVQHRFMYGIGDSAVELTCELPVRVCEDCQAQFVDEAGETARHEAVCRHLGIMTPAEIQALRQGYGMTQAGFSELTGIGEASLSRWENGAGFQTKAFDSYLYLLRVAENVRRLRARSTGGIEVQEAALRPRGRFQCIEATEPRIALARRFELRPAA
jgi:putative zinc finger/helix-turn-helix YgiT family protein